MTELEPPVTSRTQVDLPATPLPFGTRTGRWRRPVIILAITLLLHLLLLDWADSPVGRKRGSHVEQVITLLLPRATVPVVPPAAVKPAPVVRPHVARVRKKAPPIAPPVPPPSPPPPEEVPPVLAATTDPAPDMTAATTPETEGTEPIHPIMPDSPAKALLATGESMAEESAAVQPPAATVAPPPSANLSAKFALPPSAEVKYDVQALRDGKIVYGNGKISWRSNGGNYSIDGEAGMLFFSVLTFRSEGAIDQDGIAPLKYSEKRFRKAETNTHFQRNPKVISFSASTASYPRTGGEQDRASIIWQLAAIGRGDSARFVPGAALDVFVAGVRDGESWIIKVIGEETIDVGGSALRVWHLQRLPRAGSYDTQVDIWLAPAREWYPVKLRQTERNGDYLDMAMSKITPL